MNNDINLIPRVVPGKEHYFPENLWSLALALRHLTKECEGYFSMATYGPTIFHIRKHGDPHHMCGSSACAVGFGRLLGVGCKVIPSIPEHSSEYAWYAEGHLWNGFVASPECYELYASVWDWLFSTEWAHIDDTPLFAAERIAFFLCHPEAILPEDELDDQYTRLCHSGGLFDRWQREFRWDVIPEIPGAKEAADKALAAVDAWIASVAKNTPSESSKQPK